MNKRLHIYKRKRKKLINNKYDEMSKEIKKGNIKSREIFVRSGNQKKAEEIIFLSK